jgi:hypothetical protein
MQNVGITVLNCGMCMDKQKNACNEFVYRCSSHHPNTLVIYLRFVGLAGPIQDAGGENEERLSQGQTKSFKIP